MEAMNAPESDGVAVMMWMMMEERENEIEELLAL
jgi:hypothetical protein